MNAILSQTLGQPEREQIRQLAIESHALGHELIAEELDSLATSEPPVVPDLLQKILTQNIPVDLGSPLRQLVDVIEDLRRLLTALAKPEVLA